MEVSVSNQIIEVLNALCDKFGIAINWTGQNVLPYVQELMGKAVSYELWTSVAWLAIFVVATIVAYGICFLGNDRVDWDTRALFTMIGITVFIVCGIGITCQVFDIITCITFPEKIVYHMIQIMMAS